MKRGLLIIIVLILILITLVFAYIFTRQDSTVGTPTNPAVILNPFINNPIEQITPPPSILSGEGQGKIDHRIQIPETLNLVNEIIGDSDDEIVSEETFNEVLSVFPKLTRVFKGRTAGYRITGENETTKIEVIEQGEGNRYEVALIPYKLEKVGGREFVKVIKGHSFENGRSLLIYENPDDETTTKSAFVNFNTSENSNIQIFDNNILTTTNNLNKLFYLRPTNNGSIGVVLDVTNPTDTTVLWESGIKKWIPRWSKGDFINLSLPSSFYSTGDIYLIDSTDREVFFKFFKSKTGLTAFIDSDSSTAIKYESESLPNSGSTYIENFNNNTRFQLKTTLPEKCDSLSAVFICGVPEQIPRRTLSGHTTLFPDSWYQGDLSFKDQIIAIDALTKEANVLLDSDDSEIKVLSENIDFDIMEPQISPDGDFFFFINKKDLALWALKL